MGTLDNIIDEFNAKYEGIYSADYYTQNNCDSPTYRLFNSDGKPIVWYMWGCITFKTDVIFSLETVLAAGELFGLIAKHNKEIRKESE